MSFSVIQSTDRSDSWALFDKNFDMQDEVDESTRFLFILTFEYCLRMAEVRQQFVVDFNGSLL